ncbi:MAG: hypothetical protein QNK18_00090, partial [Gammaproteobacteria bacterium]|nr:hypothetical protein [Gammaproteobacteria bacterium]
MESPAAIPKPVSQAPVLPPPRETIQPETYTVVVNDVAVKELLFALARDAAINVDIHPQIAGTVTLNAVDQTLEQILQRLSGQVALRYEQRADTLVILPDTPFLRTYRVDYVNLSRESSNSLNLSNELASGESALGGGGSRGASRSEIIVRNTADNQFWKTLGANITAMLAQKESGEGTPGPGSKDVIVNAEAGVVTVRATAGQHAIVTDYLEKVLASARRQVIIEATIV